MRKKFEEEKEEVIERVSLMWERTKTPFSKKMKFAFVELPRFRKTAEELETNVDRWLFTLKNLSRLKDRPALVQGKIFEKLFELAEIKQLTEENMKQYKKSVLDYYDVQDAMNYARKEGIEEGMKKVIQKCLQKNMLIEDIVFLTGYSKEQIIHYRMNNMQ